MNAWSNKNRRLGRRTVVTVTAALAALGIGGGVALATIPSSNGTINGCYRTTGGALRASRASKARRA